MIYRERHLHNIHKNTIHIPKNNGRISMGLDVAHWYLQAPALILSNRECVFSWYVRHLCPTTVLSGELCVHIKNYFLR